MQVYRELRVLTARPTAGGERSCRIAYGVRPAAEAGSVAWWRARRLEAMEVARAAGRLPILTGGTGLYFAALIDGLATSPTPARSPCRGPLVAGGTGPRRPLRRLARSRSRHRRAAEAQRQPAHRPRMGGLAWHRTGLAAWQTERPAAGARGASSPSCSIRRARHAAGRHRRPVRRQCWRDGAVDEVRGLLALKLDPALPAMRRTGFRN